MSELTRRALSRVSDNGFARAKKLADLAIKTNVDGNGKPTSAGYEQAISYLQPFLSSANENNAIDAQRLIAGYSNSHTKLSKSKKDQNETVAAFKLQEMDSYFTSFDGDIGNFRNPGNLIEATSQSLDQLTLGVMNAIDDKQANGESTDALESYLRDLNKRSSSLRDLSNKFASGQLGKGLSLDGFGYYVDTNPIDGTVRSAALIPTSLAPDGLTNGFRRLTATAKVGDALIPVYAPAQKDSSGEYVAKVGDAVWKGSGEGALEGNSAGKSTFLFEEGGFDIGDRNKFSTPKIQIDKGQFGIGFVGKDESGNAVEAVVYRGANGKLYRVNSDMLKQFSQDPVMSSKLNGYIPRFSPTEMQSLIKESEPLSQDLVGRQGQFISNLDRATEAQSEADRLNAETSTFFGAMKKGMSESKSFPQRLSEDPAYQEFKSKADAAGVSASEVGFANYKKWGNNINNPNKPEPSAFSRSNLIEKGKQIFSGVGSFFKNKLSVQ